MKKLFTEEFKPNEIMIHSKDYPNGIPAVNHPKNPSLPETLSCYIGKEGYRYKPKEQYEVIKQRMRYSFITKSDTDFKEGGLVNNWILEDIREYLINGHSIQNGEFRAPEAEENELSFSGSQFIKANMVIFDIHKGNPTIESLLESMKPFRPTMIYKTLSHSKSKKTYRVLFVLNEFIEGASYKAIIEYLVEKIPGANKACKDIGRVYFGGKGISFFEPNITLADDFESIPEVIELRKTEKEKYEGIEIKKKITVNERIIRDYFKKQEGKKNIDSMETFKYINGFSLAEMIGVNVWDRFRCIMPGHYDKTQLATIMRIEGIEQYKCHGCEDQRAQSMLNVIMKITGKGRTEASNFTMKHLGTQIDSEYRENALKALQFNRIFLTKNQETDIYKKLKTKRLLGTYISFINYVENYLPNHPIQEGSISMFISIRHLSKTFKDWRIEGAAVSTISNKMRDLTSYGLIEKIAHKDLPESYRIESIKNSAKNGYKYSVTYWRIPELSEEILERALGKMEDEKDSGYTKRHTNRVQMIRMHGEEDARKVYNQDEMIYNDIADQRVTEAAARLMNEQNYFTKSQLLSVVAASDRKVHQYLPGIAKEFGYKYKTINNELRKELGIDLPRGSKLYIDEFGIF